MMTWVDLHNIYNKIEYETPRYYYVTYSNDFKGQRFGNINVFDKRTLNCVFRATRRRQKTYDELKAFARKFEEKPVK